MVTSSGSLRSAAVVVLCAVAGMLGTVEARFTSTTKYKGRSFSERYTGRRKASGRRKIRKTRCAKRWGFCRGHYSHSRYPCCQNPADECKRISKHFAVCYPKPKELKEDGERCDTDDDCKNACLSTACDDIYDEECEGPAECGSLPTVDYEEDYEAPPSCNALFATCDNGGGCCDADGNSKAACLPEDGGESICKPTVPCDVDGEPCSDNTSCCGICEADSECERDRKDGDPPCPRFCEAPLIVAAFRQAPCPGRRKYRGQVCKRRRGPKHNCAGRLRCASGKIRLRRGGYRSVGICKPPPAKPLFNC